MKSGRKYWFTECWTKKFGGHTENTTRCLLEIKKEGVEVKIVASLQSIPGSWKIIRNLREGTTRKKRRCGLYRKRQEFNHGFLVRKLRSSDDLKDLKIISIVDRVDLEEQLADTLQICQRILSIIDSKADLQNWTMIRANLNIVMIHKFLVDNNVSAQSLIDAGIVPHLTSFETINASDRILLMVDEAHRTQGGDMGDNLFNVFPSACSHWFYRNTITHRTPWN